MAFDSDNLQVIKAFIAEHKYFSSSFTIFRICVYVSLKTQTAFHTRQGFNF